MGWIGFVGFARTATLHNARFGLSPKILYPYHPLFGQDYEVFGAAGGKRDLVYIRLADKSSKGIPAWMFDPGVCAGVRLCDEPSIDCDALSRLAHLLDSTAPDAPNEGYEPATGTQDETDGSRGRGSATTKLGVSDP